MRTESEREAQRKYIARFAFINLRLEKDFKEMLDLAADESNMSTAAYLRKAAEAQMKRDAKRKKAAAKKEEASLNHV